ncbi:hypothetical protein BIW11_04978 [Tropilaelaps mercedesae]|uniref:Uncharacterized protein n=1 Tax=Tropilaelaps mercedesae TaxID=418985 RepID=A0A1V9WZ40_9ACAR|nr:hypothetical protein BIW11_04978 [Tropilaelaps mercedesae]
MNILSCFLAEIDSGLIGSSLYRRAAIHHECTALGVRGLTSQALVGGQGIAEATRFSLQTHQNFGEPTTHPTLRVGELLAGGTQTGVTNSNI